MIKKESKFDVVIIDTVNSNQGNWDVEIYFYIKFFKECRRMHFHSEIL